MADIKEGDDRVVTLSEVRETPMSPENQKLSDHTADIHAFKRPVPKIIEKKVEVPTLQLCGTIEVSGKVVGTHIHLDKDSERLYCIEFDDAETSFTSLAQYLSDNDHPAPSNVMAILRDNIVALRGCSPEEAITKNLRVTRIIVIDLDND